jgi:hypothetical protein
MYIADLCHSYKDYQRRVALPSVVKQQLAGANNYLASHVL